MVHIIKTITIEAQMKNILFSFLFSIILFSYAEASNISSTDDLCAFSSDTYETPTRIGTDSKKFTSQCIDTQQFRPAVIIEETDESIQFANYYHNNKYWTATLSKKAEVESVYFHIVRFNVVTGVTAAHTQYRVKFKAGSQLELTPQNTETTEDSQLEKLMVNDLVISFEAARPKNIPYNFALGAVNNYLSVARVLSGAQRVSEKGDNDTEQYEVLIPKNEKLLFAIMGIKKSSGYGFSRFYNTLRPNCTTDVFDLIDELPSQQANKAEPFLTVISNDPVAGPSLDGLKERGLLGKRYADLKAEIIDGETVAPPQIVKKPSLELLANIESHPYSLVFIEKNSSKNTSYTKSVAYKLAPKIAQQIGSLLMSRQETTLLGTLDALSPLLKQSLKELNSELSDKPSMLSLYLVPWDGSGKKINPVKDLGAPARLPFGTYESKSNDFHKITQGYAKSSKRHMANKKPFSLLGIALHMYLVKNKSIVTVQTMANLGSQQQELEVSNNQVDIFGFEIPSSYTVEQQPIALMNLSQKYQEEAPEFKINFGALGPVAGMLIGKELPGLGYTENSNAKDYGKLQVLKGHGCSVQASTSPTLFGKLKVLTEKKWKNVKFNILSIDFDLNKKEVKTMDVRISTLPVFCISKPDVNQQFTDNANSEIEAIKAKALEAEKSVGLTILNKVLAN